MTTEQVMQANPWMTYAQAIGFVSGIEAKKRGNPFAGLSMDEWRFATDDYAHGYRQGYNQ